MALDATVGGASADTYGTLTEANTYWTARQSAAWGSSDAVKEYALRKAAQFLDNVYRGKWKGQKVDSAQALAWPRGWVTDAEGFGVPSDSIPQQVKNAQFEAAKIIAGGTELEATIERAVKREQVGALMVEYMDGASLKAQYPQVTGWISDLVIGGSGVGSSYGSSAIVRA
jgi:hypothetical protein